MPKYLVLFNSTVSARQQMQSSTPEQMKAGMDDWMAWKDKVSQTITFEWGLPLQAVAQVTTDGLMDGSNPASGYSILEGDSKEVILDLLKDHPHLKMPGATIDVLD